MGLSLHSKMHQCLTLFPVLFLQSLYALFILGSTVPCEDSDKVQYSSSNRVKTNHVFVNELFRGC